MTMHTRRPLERIVRIHDQIRRGGFPNCNSMAGTLEVTPKTVQRDVSFMKDGMGLPLEYDGQKHGYYYTKPVGDFPRLEATAEDLVSLFVARTALGALEGTPLEATLKQNLRRLAAMLGGTVTLSWSNLERAVSSKRPGTLRKRELSRFETVARALLESRELKFEYRKLAADTDGWETRKIRPYHLAEVDNGWYIIGHDINRNAYRTFALQRMRNVTLSRENRFRVPDDFDPAKHFGGSLGIWPHSESTAGRYQVKIRFTGWAARFVPERQWHPSQDFYYEDPGGETSLIAIFTLDTLEEMIRWILGWGKHAEVLEPPELIAAVKSHLSEALGKYP